MCWLHQWVVLFHCSGLSSSQFCETAVLTCSLEQFANQASLSPLWIPLLDDLHCCCEMCSGFPLCRKHQTCGSFFVCFFFFFFYICRSSQITESLVSFAEWNCDPSERNENDHSSSNKLVALGLLVSHSSVFPSTCLAPLVVSAMEIPTCLQCDGWV